MERSANYIVATISVISLKLLAPRNRTSLIFLALKAVLRTDFLQLNLSPSVRPESLKAYVTMPSKQTDQAEIIDNHDGEWSYSDLAK